MDEKDLRAFLRLFLSRIGVPTAQHQCGDGQQVGEYHPLHQGEIGLEGFFHVCQETPMPTQCTYNIPISSLSGGSSVTKPVVEARMLNYSSTTFVAVASHSAQGKRTSYALSTRPALHAR